MYSPHYRAERLIAGARLALLSVSTAAVLLAPPESLADSRLAYALLAGYGLYAAVLAAMAWDARLPFAHPWAGLLVDTVAALALVYTVGPRNAICPMLALPVLSASVVIGRLVALCIAAAIGAMWLSAKVAEANWSPERGQMAEALVQVAWLIVCAAVVAEVSARAAAWQGDVWSLLTARDPTGSDGEALVRRLPELAATVLKAPVAVVAWEEGDEPWLYVGTWSDGNSRVERERPGLGELVAPELADCDFFGNRQTMAAGMVIRSWAKGFTRWEGEALGARLRERFAPATLVSTRFDAGSIRGRLFVFDRLHVTSDDLALARMVARQIETRLEQFALVRRLAEKAAVEERVRLGRDLHDGVLHLLASVAIELEGLIRESKEKHGVADARLRELQSALAIEQRTLRMLIGRFRRSGQSIPERRPSLSERFRDLIEGIERRWEVKVEWRAAELDLVPDSLADEVYLAVREGLTNAGRHSGASVVRITVRREGQLVRVVISDDGAGFPFRGRYDDAVLGSLRAGPRTLRERMVALSGSLVIDSSEGGARVELSFPVGGVTA